MSAKAETLADVFATDIAVWSKSDRSLYRIGRIDGAIAALGRLDAYVSHMNDLASRRESEGLSGEAAGLRAAVALLGGGR